MRECFFREPGYLIEEDRPREECGIFGIYFPHPDFPKEIVTQTLSGLLANQHRGEESAGICVADGNKVSRPFKKMGWIKHLHERFRELDEQEKQSRGLEGYLAVAHTRYSTTGSSKIENAAPFVFKHRRLGDIAVCHNGNITNADELKQELVQQKVKFKSTTDSEIIGALVVKSPGLNWEEKIKNALKRLEGSFSLILCTKDALYAVRDPIGNRPLSIAQFRSDGIKGFAVSSESAAFQSLDIHYKREIKPGEMFKIQKDSTESIIFEENLPPQAFCGLEIAYLMRPDSRIAKEGIQLDTIRRHLGAELALMHPLPEDVDLVTYIPESAKSAAEGFVDAISHNQNRIILSITSTLKNRYGTIDGGLRGFIQPGKVLREDVARNYSPLDILKGKKIVMVDDSIIRGTTTGGIINTIKNHVGDSRDCGAKEIHLRIIFPPVIGFCPLGTDINKNDTLLANQFKTIEEMRKFLGVDSLAFLTPQEYKQGINEVLHQTYGICEGCTTGKYPVAIFQADKAIFERPKC